MSSVRISRLALSATVVVALVAPSFAQEMQQDLAERIVKEQGELRRTSLDSVMSAPARAFDHADNDPFGAVAAADPAGATVSAAATAAPLRRKSQGSGVPWVLLACLLPIIPLALLALASWRKWRFQGR